MSLLGFDSVGSATINGLTEVNANNVFSDVLYYDADTVPVNVKTAIAGVDADVTVLEGQMVTANANIATLQGQMTTANTNISTLQGQVTTLDGEVNTLQSEMNDAQSDINTLQSEMNTAQGDINDLESDMNNAQSDINTLQSEMNTAQADIIALYSVTSTTAAAVAGLAISQAAQDVIITANGSAIGTLQGQVGTLQGQMSTANANISLLETKTQLQSYDAINVRTEFTNDLQLTGTATYRGSQIITTGSGTFFNVNTTEDINAGTNITATTSITAGTDLISTAGIAYINRATASAKKLVLYDNGTGNNFEYLGQSVSTDGFNQFLNYNVNSVNSEHRFLYGASSATAKQILSLNPTNTALTTNAIDFRAKDITSVNRDAGITISNNSSAFADLGTLGVYAGIINIGTQAAFSTVNIGSIGSVVNIIGIVNITQGQNFSMINSFFQQF